MNLLLDIGNTQAVVGIYKGKEKIDSWRFSSKLFTTEDEIATMIRNFLKFRDIEFKEIHRVVIASVVPELSFVLNRFGEKYFNQIPLFISHELKLPISIKYEPQASVGADRIAASVAAYSEFKSDLIVIDFGTATTFEVVTKEGDYLGGAISLGIQGQMSALNHNASKLPKVDLNIPNGFIGKTTDTSIQSGIILGNICMVRGMIEGIKNELNTSDIKVVATGGLASMVSQKIPEIDEVRNDIVLEGMLQILEIN